MIDPLADMIPGRENLRYEPEADQKLPGRSFEPSVAPGNSSLIPEQDADQKAGSQPLEPGKSETLLMPEQSADQKPRGEYSEFAESLEQDPDHSDDSFDFPESPEQDAGHKAGRQPLEPGKSETLSVPEQDAAQQPRGQSLELAESPEQDADHRRDSFEFSESSEQGAEQKPRSQLVAPGQSEIEQHADQKPRGRPFELGKSGNPQGRPKGSRNKANLLMEAMMEGEAQQIMSKLIEKALAGDRSALRFCGDRLLAPRRSRTVQFELPPIEKPEDAQKAAAAVLAACANGELAPSEATNFMSLIQAYASLTPSEPSAADTTSDKKVVFRGSPADLLSALNKSKKE